MVSRIALLLMLARLMLGIQLLYPVGSEVHVTLRNGAESNGEILAVRDSCIVFSSIETRSQSGTKKMSDVAGICLIPIRCR